MSDPAVPTELLDPSPFPQEVHVIYPIRRRYWLHLLLFLATIFTTLIVGARLQYNFSLGLPQFHSDADLFPLRWALEQPSRLILGIPFSVTLLSILLAHEMGHFVYAQRHRVYATLPFFLPAPTLIGTFGAFIRIRSPIRSRAALFDIGIAGPIAGFVVAVPVLIFSLMNAWPAHTSGDSGLAIGFPLIFDAVWKMFPAHSHLRLDQLSLSPSAIAAWVGMFATALNLLPGGQLDGGHIIYALTPRWHRTISRLTTLALIPMGIFLWTGWLLWAVFLLLSLMRHPPVPEYPPLSPARKALAWFALLMFVLSLAPEPFAGAGLLDVIK
ncbi:MAG: site-2 protease family protein [Acidobacteria bacterium]|nr:site-2 protease family protein [Acidobacteriota bacterium]